jgi:hypothetical protein
MLSPILALPPCVNGHVTFPAPKAAFSGSVNPPCVHRLSFSESSTAVAVSAAEVGKHFSVDSNPPPPPPPYATSSGSRPIRTRPDYFQPIAAGVQNHVTIPLVFQ